MKKATALYDFTLTAFGSQTILADANFYKILTSAGDVSITRDGGSTVKPMRAGRGERNVDFLSLIIRDLSGAANAGTIVVGDSEFIDDTIVLSSAINVRPETSTGNYNVLGASVANTAIQILAPASNTAGVMVLTASIQKQFETLNGVSAFLAKASAPANVGDGESIFSQVATANSATSIQGGLHMPMQVMLAPGLGIYYISSVAEAATLKTMRWKAL